MTTEKATRAGDIIWYVNAEGHRILRCRALEVSKSGSTLIVHATRSDGSVSPQQRLLAPQISRLAFDALPDAVACLLQEAEGDVRKASAALKAAKQRLREAQADAAAWDLATSSDRTPR